MATASRAKHKLCRRVGQCIWGSPKCPSAKRPYPAGSHGKTGRKKKLSTYGELLMEKQKLRMHYAISEEQLRVIYKRAQKGIGKTDERLASFLEQRLDAVLFRSRLAPTIFAAKQAISHGHILVNGKKVDRSSYVVKEGFEVSINAEKSPAIAEAARASATNVTVPSYLQVDTEALKITLIRTPQIEEIPHGVKIISVIEYYAR